MNDALIVFVKAPRPGLVKTRLAAEIGAERAAAVYRRLAETEIRGTAPLRGEYDRLFFFTPKGAEAEVRAWLGPVALRPQEGSDLGARMMHAFGQAFAGGARRAAIIGTDVPAARRSHVRDALDALDDHDAAIGPAHDGGYYLLATSRPRPELFAGIPWGTGDVLHRTLERIGHLGLSVRILETLTDVDTLDDVRHEWPLLRRLLPAPVAAELAARHGLEVDRPPGGTGPGDEGAP